MFSNRCLTGIQDKSHYGRDSVMCKYKGTFALASIPWAPLMISIQVTGYESDTLIILKLVNLIQIVSVASHFCKDNGYSVSMLVLSCRNRSIRRAIFHLFCLAVICLYVLLNIRFVCLHFICSPNEFAAIRESLEVC